MGDASLEFVAMPALAPPEIVMDPQWQQKLEQEMQQAEKVALPEDDEEDL